MMMEYQAVLPLDRGWHSFEPLCVADGGWTTQLVHSQHLL